jgi:hypothetical protein
LRLKRPPEPNDETTMNEKPPKTPRATAADFHPEVLRLFDGYVHGRIDRRGFLEAPRNSRSAASARRRCSRC